MAKKTDEADALAAKVKEQKKDIRKNGVKAEAILTDTFRALPGVVKTSEGPFLFGLKLDIALKNGKKKKTTSVHIVPADKTAKISVDGKFPVIVVPDARNMVMIDWSKYDQVDGKKVLNEHIKRLQPLFKELGYKKVSTRTFNRTVEDGLVHVINFQADAYGHDFTVNIAVFLDSISRFDSNSYDLKRIDESECEILLRQRIGTFTKKGHDTWWRYDGDQEKIAKELHTVFTQRVIPYLEKMSTAKQVKAQYKKAERESEKARKEHEEKVAKEMAELYGPNWKDQLRT